MKRVILLLLLLAFLPGSAQDTERILLYDVELRVDTSATLTVTETIRVNARGLQIQRGIFRILPARREINGRDIAVRYNVRSVRKNGEKEKYHTKRENDAYLIYIGDEDVFLSPGVYEYEIVYDTYRQIGFFENFDELYWNVTGTDWVFPIDQVQAKVVLPANAYILQHSCYTGEAGSTAQNCETADLLPHGMGWTAENLRPYQGLTVATGFTKGVIHEPEIPALLKTGNLWKILAGLGLALIAWMGSLWNRYGRDHPTPTVYPQFEVPEGLSPASLGYLHHGKYRQNFLSSSLINLAVKGYLTIHEIPKSGRLGHKKFTLKKLKAADSRLPDEESILLNDLFGGKETATIDGQYNSTIASAVQTYHLQMTDTHRPQITQGNNWKKVSRIFLGISIVYWGLLLYSHIHLYDPTKWVLGILLYVGALFTHILMVSVRLKAARYMVLFPLIFTGIVVTIWYFTSRRTPDAFFLAYLFLMISVTFMAIFNYLIKQPSPELLARQSLINGFKMYLEAAESRLLQFHNPPRMTPELFEKYLPYALVLGVDGIWGKKFEQSLQNQAQPYENHWYTGSTHFSGHLTRSLSQGLTGTLSSSSVSPSSSGSGGGGSSGGGGGGGGGGGW